MTGFDGCDCILRIIHTDCLQNCLLICSQVGHVPSNLTSLFVLLNELLRVNISSLFELSGKIKISVTPQYPYILQVVSESTHRRLHCGKVCSTTSVFSRKEVLCFMPNLLRL